MMEADGSVSANQFSPVEINVTSDKFEIEGYVTSFFNA